MRICLTKSLKIVTLHAHDACARYYRTAFRSRPRRLLIRPDRLWWIRRMTPLRWNVSFFFIGSVVCVSVVSDTCFGCVTFVRNCFTYCWALRVERVLCVCFFSFLSVYYRVQPCCRLASRSQIFRRRLVFKKIRTTSRNESAFDKREKIN